MRSITKWGLTTAAFIIMMTIKVTTDWPHWDGGVTQYVISTVVIIPVIWYAGWFFREAVEDVDKPL